jgi:DNA-directed RNA polymerase specialized sigma24 family protein
MKNYAQSDYAVNKNAGGIVYRLADQQIEVTLEDYLLENPGKNAADFAELKALSDADYYETDRSDYRQTWKNTSLDTLDEDESAYFATHSMEDEVIERWEQAAINSTRKSIAARAINKLTEVQRRRYLMYHVAGLSTWEIADREDVNQSKIVNSLKLADKKIQKILSEGKK